MQDHVYGGIIGALSVLIPILGAWVIKWYNNRMERRQQKRTDALMEWQGVVNRLDTDIKLKDQRIGQLETASKDCEKRYSELLVSSTKQDGRIQSLLQDVRRLQLRTGEVTGAILPVVITATADDGIIRDVGPQVGAMFHWTRKELIGKNVEILIPDIYKEQYHKGMAEIASGIREADPAKSIHGHAIRQDGLKFPVIITLTSWLSPQTNRVFVNAEIHIDTDPIAAHPNE
jgi:PAS domain S-box-containing protein